MKNIKYSCTKRYFLTNILVILFILMFVNISQAGVLDSIKESWRVKTPYDTTEKFLLTGLYLGQLGDYASTKNALNRGCVEGNSTFYGENPSDGALIAGKVLTSLVFTWAANNTTNHTGRKILLGFGTIAGGGITYYNMNINCK